MGLLTNYEKLPWLFQATAPLFFIATLIFYFQLKLSLNFFEFIGMTFSVVSSCALITLTCQFLYRNWIGVMLGHNIDLKSLGPWAIVTGPTQGIGRAYADALAKRGLNLILIGRSPDKLSQVALEIQEKNKVEIKLIQADFTGTNEVYEEIEKQIGDAQVGILINNVGMCYPYPEFFSDLPGGRKFCRDLINCNMLSVTMMTDIVLPGMIERKKGVIVNVGSLASVLDTPFMSLYGASKSFVDKFTTDLHLEYQHLGITIQSVIPGYVVSNMSKIKKSTMFIPTPDDYVEAALKGIGLQKRTAVWLTHQLLHFIVHVGQFFRRDGASTVSQIFGKKIWYYGKKVTLYREKKGE